MKDNTVRIKHGDGWTAFYARANPDNTTIEGPIMTTSFETDHVISDVTSDFFVATKMMAMMLRI